MANEISYGTAERLRDPYYMPCRAGVAIWHLTQSCHVHIKCEARNYYLRRSWCVTIVEH